MKLLLTSGGVMNASIQAALVDLLGKPVAESNALCVLTALYPMRGGAQMAWQSLTEVGEHVTPMCAQGWKTTGLFELTALPSLDEDVWVSALEETDALLVAGGDPMYLAHWMAKSGVADRLRSLPDLVYVGVSAGSMVMTPRIGEDFVNWRPPTGDDTTLGLVDFSIFPHLDHVMLPENTMADAQRWAADLSAPAYAIDDETAIKVADGTVEVISEGHWHKFD